jgi:hypothetical protein
MLTEQAKNQIYNRNINDYNTHCTIALRDKNDFEFKAFGKSMPWYKVQDRANACSLEVSGVDTENNPAKCDMTNAILYDPLVVRNIYLDDTMGSTKRCVVEFNDKSSTNDMNIYLQKQRSYKEVEGNGLLHQEIDNQRKKMVKIEHDASNEKQALQARFLQEQHRAEEQAAQLNAQYAKSKEERDSWQKLAQESQEKYKQYEILAIEKEAIAQKQIQAAKKQVQDAESERNKAQSMLMDSTKPKDCLVSDWGNWASCNKPCGGGSQTRSRTVTQQASNGGKGCPSLSEARSCNTQMCAVDCKVSDWGNWASCDKPCGGGSQTRSRTVTKQASNGGKGCPSLSEARSCNTQMCAVDCKVSDWGNWASCDKPCGGGSQTRSRTVTKQASNGGKECPPLNEVQQCNLQSCQLYEFKSFVFTTGGLHDARRGPDLSLCQKAYASQPWVKNTSYFNVKNGHQLWTVPLQGKYTISVFGASGGNGGTSQGGIGAMIKSTLNLLQNDKIVILVGQKGGDGSKGGGGGGGSFVYKSNTLLIAAGGGGGGGVGIITENANGQILSIKPGGAQYDGKNASTTSSVEDGYSGTEGGGGGGSWDANGKGWGAEYQGQRIMDWNGEGGYGIRPGGYDGDGGFGGGGGGGKMGGGGGGGFVGGSGNQGGRGGVGGASYASGENIQTGLGKPSQHGTVEITFIG